MKVLKFGGSSVADENKIQSVINIVKNYNVNQTVVVLSAFGGVTNKLLALVHQATIQDNRFKEDCLSLEVFHINIVKKLISNKIKEDSIRKEVKNLFAEILNLLNGIFLVKECSDKTLDYIMGFGERLSAYIISEAFIDRNINCMFVDSRQLIKTDSKFGAAKGIGAKVCFDTSNHLILDFFKKNKKLKIITGFIASDKEGVTTTLGRNGSDYTASIIASAIDADCLEIWKEVDGVLTSDPRLVNNALVLPSITYEEAMELSHFGANVIHPFTMPPIMKKNIPILIKNTFNTKSSGTIIQKKTGKEKLTVKGVTGISNICLLQLKGTGLVGIPSSSQRLFDTLLSSGINAILITQASSQYSISVCINQEFANKAKSLIDQEFRLEIQHKEIDPLHIEKELCIVALIGEGMKNQLGTAGKMFGALASNGINIMAIAQGSSELNISVVIPEKDKPKALNAIHDAFFLSGQKSIYLFLVGTGLIASSLAKMILKQLPILRKQYNIDIKLLAVAKTDKMLFAETSIDFINFKQLLIDKGEKSNLKEFVDRVIAMNYSNSILVDCTSSEEIISHYAELLSKNISIVTPNKKANSSSYNYYSKLQKIVNSRGVSFFYETNVGAGLPIISTIKDLLNSGDIILKIEAVLSGTLNYIFSNFNEKNTFSDVVKEAKQKGYTEPDPRDDLNGMDVARKILILAREVGNVIEMKDIEVESLVPKDCIKIKNIDAFFAQLETHNANFESQRKNAENKKQKLRYVAVFENGKAKVKLTTVDENHPFYALNGSDNIICITSERYKMQPLVIKGPGAGADVTAAGVFADIIKIANNIKK